MTNYLQLSTESVVRKRLLRIAVEADDRWKPNNGIERIDIDIKDLEGDDKIIELAEHFKCKEMRKLSLFRFQPRTCHAWHVDLQRYAAVNMLLEGWDSITLFGERADGINLKNIDQLIYEYDRYYLLNSKMRHTVINFSRPRYLLSIGIPEEFRFQEVQDYIQRTGT